MLFKCWSFIPHLSQTKDLGTLLPSLAVRYPDNYCVCRSGNSSFALKPGDSGITACNRYSSIPDPARAISVHLDTDTVSPRVYVSQLAAIIQGNRHMLPLLCRTKAENLTISAPLSQHYYRQYLVLAFMVKTLRFSCIRFPTADMCVLSRYLVLATILLSNLLCVT